MSQAITAVSAHANTDDPALGKTQILILLIVLLFTFPICEEGKQLLIRC